MNFIDKLPTSLLEIVFESMHYEQKKQCKLVCRLWNQILGSGLDVETTTIRGKSEFHAFIESAQNISLDCKALMLCHYQSLPMVAKLFPNLKFFVFKPVDEYNHLNQNRVPYSKREIESFLVWHRHLRVFINSQLYEDTHQFLNTGVFQKLTALALVHDYMSKSCRNVISSLKNAPNLQILQLKRFPLYSHDLNMLHNNVTRLHTLILDRCYTFSVEPVNAPIAPPAKSMKTLTVVNADNFILDNGELLKFMVSKYPSLDYLSITAIQKDDA
jgi:hypothetical protein